MSEAPPRHKPAAPLAVAPPPVAAPAAPAAAPATDVVLLGPPTADGAGVHVIRARDERIEAGELRAIQEGRPIVGEIVTLKPRESNPHICDVTDSFSVQAASPAPPAQLGHKGPAKVATRAYREGWDEIFGPKPKPSGPAN
ncbi:MAG TPA: hypothetical protein VLT33_19770 [Labilithrix sp.]|nr:hypothetical protein [Labilithrix sp.]